MSGWNGLDFFIFLILVVNTILGMSRGATKEIISMMCLSAALIFTIVFTMPLTRFMNSSPIIHDLIDTFVTKNFMEVIGAGPLTYNLVHQISYSIALLICFVGVFGICEAGLSRTGFLEVFSFPYATLNRKVGATLGFTRGYIITLILLSILILHIFRNDTGPTSRQFFDGSFFAKLFRTQYQKLDELISSERPENYQQLYQNQPYNVQDIYKQIGPPTVPLQPQNQNLQQNTTQPSQ